MNLKLNNLLDGIWGESRSVSIMALALGEELERQDKEVIDLESLARVALETSDRMSKDMKDLAEKEMLRRIKEYEASKV